MTQTDRMDQVPRVEGSGCQVTVLLLLLFPMKIDDMMIESKNFDTVVLQSESKDSCTQDY